MGLQGSKGFSSASMCFVALLFVPDFLKQIPLEQIENRYQGLQCLVFFRPKLGCFKKGPWYTSKTASFWNPWCRKIAILGVPFC